MLTSSIAILASIVVAASDTTIVLARLERDLTGDDAPEVLAVVAAGPSIDSLTNVQFTIEAAGRMLYQFRLAPLTRTVGYDGGRRSISAQEHRARLRDFAGWFFAESKFQRPAAFVNFLRRSLRLHIPEIPAVMTRYRHARDSSDAATIWKEMQSSPVTIFTFSPGGDAIVSIGWSARTRSFYRLLECC
jgi:hypothetical protein